MPHRSNTTLDKIAERFFPSGVRQYCLEVFGKYDFDFKVTKGRRTKLGDYRYDSRSGRHTITVNGDLNPYSFMVTFLHEVAHLITFEIHKHKAMPHGAEWKKHFSRLLEYPVASGNLPAALNEALAAYMKNPAASSCTDDKLYRTLRSFDAPTDLLLLENLAKDEMFVLGKRIFKKNEVKRTRCMATEVSTGRKFLISLRAEVVPYSKQSGAGE